MASGQDDAWKITSYDYLMSELMKILKENGQKAEYDEYFTPEIFICRIINLIKEIKYETTTQLDKVKYLDNITRMYQQQIASLESRVARSETQRTPKRSAAAEAEGPRMAPRRLEGQGPSGGSTPPSQGVSVVSLSPFAAQGSLSPLQFVSLPSPSEPVNLMTFSPVNLPVQVGAPQVQQMVTGNISPLPPASAPSPQRINVITLSPFQLPGSPQFQQTLPQGVNLMTFSPSALPIETAGPQVQEMPSQEISRPSPSRMRTPEPQFRSPKRSSPVQQIPLRSPSPLPSTSGANQIPRRSPSPLPSASGGIKDDSFGDDSFLNLSCASTESDFDLLDQQMPAPRMSPQRMSPQQMPAQQVPAATEFQADDSFGDDFLNISDQLDEDLMEGFPDLDFTIPELQMNELSQLPDISFAAAAMKKTPPRPGPPRFAAGFGPPQMHQKSELPTIEYPHEFEAYLNRIREEAEQKLKNRKQVDLSKTIQDLAQIFPPQEMAAQNQQRLSLGDTRTGATGTSKAQQRSAKPSAARTALRNKPSQSQYAAPRQQAANVSRTSIGKRAIAKAAMTASKGRGGTEAVQPNVPQQRQPNLPSQYQPNLPPIPQSAQSRRVSGQTSRLQSRPNQPSNLPGNPPGAQAASAAEGSSRFSSRGAARQQSRASGKLPSQKRRY